MNNVMIDLETMGTGPRSAIASIGAVKFGKHHVTDSTLIIVRLSSCQAIGMEMDPDTVTWWMRQDEEARRRFELPGMPIDSALDALESWIGKDAVVWGNGSDFDNVILGEAYRLTNKKKPWHFAKNRCYRTIRSMCPEIELVRIGVHHDPKDDAETQAQHLIQCIHRLGVSDAIFGKEEVA